MHVVSNLSLFYNDFWFDIDFEMESKYNRKTVVLFLKARVLSLHDVFFYYFIQLSAGNWFLFCSGVAYVPLVPPSEIKNLQYINNAVK